MCRFFLFLLLSFSLGLFSQRGKNGSVIISVANSIVNLYTPLTSNAIAGTKTITVQSSLSYSVGDLIFIIQMQGASVNAGKDSIYPDLTSSIPTNTTFGAITNYNNCGNNEYHQISSIPNATSIVLDCGLKYNYDYLSKVQVIKVPRYLDLTLNGSGSITCPTWNGSIGGIAMIETKNNCILNSTPSFSVTGKGFRGGGFENATNFGGNKYGSIKANEGAYKGESIAGDTTRYKVYSAVFGRGAIANGGGGACVHNGGGGGGANGGNVLSYDGYGNPVSGYTTAWNLESPSFSTHTSSGGGRGGYTFSNSNANVNTAAPGSSSWGADNRSNVGGFGGRPLNYSTGKLFLGGGGGSGDGNESQLGQGGNGGGMVYIICYGNLQGSGTIIADGAKGANTVLGCGTNDGAGGGGGGGTIILKVNGSTSLTAMPALSAKGGDGGNVNFNCIFSNSTAYGPGASGGGGYIATSGMMPSTNLVGGANGIVLGNTSSIAANFPPNGATKGGIGSLGVVSTYSLNASSHQTICVNQSFSLTATSTEPTTSIEWFINPTGGTNIASGSTYTSLGYSTPGTYTLYAGVCPGSYRQPIIITVTSALSLSVNSPTICAGQTVTLTPIGATSYTWNTGSVSSNLIVSPLANTVYSLTGVNGACVGTKTTQVTVVTSPSVSVSQFSLCAGSSVILTASGATNYVWNIGQTTQTVSVSPTVSTNYTVIGNIGTCSNTAVSSVSVFASPNLTVNTASICSGQSATLTVSGAATYLWNNGSTNGTIIVSPTSNLNYSVTGYNGVCGSSLVTTVFVNTVTVTNYSLSIPLCANQSTTLNAGISSANSYTWSNGINTYSQVVTPLITTTYSVIGNSGNCLALVSIITVSVNSIEAQFTGIESVMVQQGSVLNLVNTSIGATNYFWEFCNTLTSTLPNQIFLAKDTGNCCIKLIAVNLTCRDSVIKCFQIANESIIIFPNVFTPNGDKINDVFKFSNSNLKDLNCTIYDRWGLKLYQWTGVLGYWDGNVKSLPAPSGTYFYILNYTTVFGEVKTEKNFFSLFRD